MQQLVPEVKIPLIFSIAELILKIIYLSLNTVLLFKDIQDYYVLLLKPSVCSIYFADFIFQTYSFKKLFISGMKNYITHDSAK